MAKGSTPKLDGVYPPIPTPFDGAGELETDQLKANLGRWNEWPLAGYVVGGSNGEFVMLTDDERVAVVRAAREAIPEDKLLIAGSGAQSTRRAISLTAAMAANGADACLVVSPNYYRRQMSAAALVEHYASVAEASAVPILLYNVPANTGINIPIEAIVELSGHANIAGMKDSGGDLVRIATIIQSTPDDFQVLAGGASFFLPALSVGAVGVVPALGNLAGRQLAQLQRLFKAGDLAQAAVLQRQLLAANQAVTAGYGVPGLKAALDMLGFYGGPTRSPLLPLTEAEKEDLRVILEQAGILG